MEHMPVIDSAPSSLAAEDDNDEEEEEKPLPWHHQQLYSLYGKDADYFLYPKTQDEVKEQDTAKQQNTNKYKQLIQGKRCKM